MSEREQELYRLSPEYIKTQVMSNAFRLIPEEGETFTFRGGLGNKVAVQTKKENGKYYKRFSEDEEWQDDDPHAKMLEFVRDIRRSAERDGVKKESKFRRILNKLF